MPSQDPEVLAKSPMGKVPYIEIDSTTLTETNVIFDYLERYPAATGAVSQRSLGQGQGQRDHPLCGAVSRRTGPAPSADRVLRRARFDQATYDAVRPLLENGLRALKQLARFEPYIAGDTFTFADLTAYFELRFTNLHTTQGLRLGTLRMTCPGLGEYLQMVGERPSVNAVDAVMQRDFAAFKNKS